MFATLELPLRGECPLVPLQQLEKLIISSEPGSIRRQQTQAFKGWQGLSSLSNEEDQGTTCCYLKRSSTNL